MTNFWQKINRKSRKANQPFFCMAPMLDVTDEAFRLMFLKYGRPDIFWTEFVSADGLVNKIGKKKILPMLKFNKKQKPIVAQIFGNKIKNIATACKIVEKLGFSGIDINMGCPEKNITKQGSGSALIKNPKLAKEIIRATKNATKLPVSVKTRIGFNKIEEWKNWLGEILEEKPSALTVHLRTKKEMSAVSAHWELAKEISKFVREKSPETVLIFNGDVASVEQGLKLSQENDCDGIMIGRGIFGNPKFFQSKVLEKKEKIKLLFEHTKLFAKHCRHKNFAVMKKHFKAYISGFDGAKELRIQLMKTENWTEVKKVIVNFLEIDKDKQIGNI